MSSSPAPPPVYYHPHPSEDQMGSGEGDEKRRKLNDYHHDNLNANDDQQQQQHNPYLMQPPPPPHGYYGGPPPPVDGQPPQDHQPPVYHYPPYQPGPYSPTGAPPQFFNGSQQQYYPAPHPLEGVATQHNPHYDDVLAPEPCHVPKYQQYNEQWNSEAATTAEHEPTILPKACHLPPRVNDNNNNEYDNNNYYDNRPVKQQVLPQVLHNPDELSNDQVSSPGQTTYNNETPTNVNIDNNTNNNNNDTTLDTRSPEGSRNLNTLEERIPTVDDDDDDEVQVVVQPQPQLEEEEPQLPQEPGQENTMAPQEAVVGEQFDNNNNVPPVDSQMIPYGMPPPPPGMQWAPQPGYNHGPPPMPPSPQHAAAYPPPPHNHVHPGMPPQPQFSGAPPGQPQFQMMSSPGMPQAPPGVVGPNGETVWPCDYCNIKFSTWEDCSAHEATCPSGVNQHQRRLDAHAAAAAAAYGGGNHNHQQQHPQPPPPHPMYGPVPGMAPPMLQPPLSAHQQQYHLSPYQAPVIPLTKANTTKSRRDRKREQMAGYPQRNGHIIIDDNAEYALNGDRTTFLLSTPADADSLSDRQCYVRSHFVEVFVADEKDVQARHSRGAQKLNVGQVGMRCAYCAKLRPRDRAERAICYPSSISRIYQTVADMQRFHFENCVAIPAKVLDMYKQLKTTRPRGVGSPGMYWDRSAREMGLMDTPLGIQAVSRNASEKVDDIAAMTIGEVGRLMLQKKSLVSGMLERLDSKPDEHIHDPSMMLANDLVDQVDMMPQVKDEEVPLDSTSTSKPQPMTEQHQDPQDSTLPPPIEEPASPGGIQTKGSNVISSPGSSADQSKDGTAAAAAGGTDAPSTPNEDANILLMLKNTDSPPQAVDDENVAKEEKEETLVVAV